MSEDEEEIIPNRTARIRRKRYIIVKPSWRSKRVDMYLRLLDSIYDDLLLGKVDKRKLTITYPSPNLTAYDPTIFTLQFGPAYSNTTYSNDFLSDGFAQLPGLNISIGGNASAVKPEVSFNPSLSQK